jgi:hypothetical protein
MPDDDRSAGRKHLEAAWPSLLVFGFGIMVLLFLIAVEHQNWFEVRPASGTAAAMANAANRMDGTL